MKLHQYYLTNNDCYRQGKRHTVRGIMVHSTAANNPYLKRYIGPDDGRLGYNRYGNHWNQPGLSKCVHAFIGKLEDGTVATYNTLPWDMVGWHSGSGSKGYAQNANNNGYIGFEICEDDLTSADYFRAVYQEAVELCAYLCKAYSLDPMKNIICHCEGHALGIASNHSDVMHWFPKFGKSMDTFRADVRDKMKGVVEIMGKYVEADKLISWITENAVDMGEKAPQPDPVPSLAAGDHVVLKNGVTTWGSGSSNKSIPTWARDGKTTFKVLEIVLDGTEARIGNDAGAYTGTAYIRDLTKVG